MKYWAVYLTTTGEIVSQVNCPTHPRFNGFPWDGTIHTAKELPAGGDEAYQTWNKTTKTWEEDPTKVETMLLDDIKRKAEQLKMGSLSPGGAKKTEYADKAREIVAWDQLGGTLAAILAALALLPPDVRAVRFAYAYADAAAHGDTPQAAIARFKAGMTKSNPVPRLAAFEAKLCLDIKNAATAAQKRAVAAAAATKWPS
jgi:hypothetical protein